MNERLELLNARKILLSQLRRARILRALQLLVERISSSLTSILWQLRQPLLDVQHALLFGPR